MFYTYVKGYDFSQMDSSHLSHASSLLSELVNGLTCVYLGDSNCKYNIADFINFFLNRWNLKSPRKEGKSRRGKL